MDKVKSMILSVLCMFVIIGIIISVIGFIAFLINVVNLQPSNIIQKISFIIVLAFGIGISYYIFSKDNKEV